jgi:murein DD-endopeptidase MepM/ murein hydrolase activator NlpD
LAEQGYTPQKIATSVADENKAVGEAISSYRASPDFNGKFIDPLRKRVIVGAFGNIRKSNGTQLQHLGVDLDAKAGTEIYTINDGVVVLAQAGFPSYGTTVVVDHGLGIFSLYLHLSEIKTTLGAGVKRGDVIGLVGNTGYSLEPHLHLSMKIKGASVDPLKFIDAFNNSFDF